MQTGNRLRLLAEVGIWVPYAVEYDKQRFNAMLVSNLQILVDTRVKTLRILTPREVVQKHAHGVHADILRVAQFAVDGGGIKRFSLPHFKLVDGGARHKIRADQPRK